MTLSDSHNATFSQAEDFGQLPLAWLDGTAIAPSGPPVVRASRSRSRAKEPVPMTLGICGPTSFASSVPEGPLSLWESKLRERLAMVGSTESALIWREKDTPAGASISRLAPWTPPISDSGSTGAQWPTPKAAAAGPDFAKMTRSATGLSLQTVMAAVPRAEEAGEWARSSPEASRPSAATVSPWVTPTVAERGRNPETLAKCADFRKRNANQKSVPLYLGEQMAETEAGGPTTDGLPATTARRGAPNPAFPCWLMGFPAEWVSGAWRAMRSRPSSRRKSSAR